MQDDVIVSSTKRGTNLNLWAAQTGKNLLRTQNVSEQNQKHFLCLQQMLRARANARVCPRLPVPLCLPTATRCRNL